MESSSKTSNPRSSPRASRTRMPSSACAGCPSVAHYFCPGRQDTSISHRTAVSEEPCFPHQGRMLSWEEGRPRPPDCGVAPIPSSVCGPGTAAELLSTKRLCWTQSKTPNLWGLHVLIRSSRTKHATHTIPRVTHTLSQQQQCCVQRSPVKNLTLAHLVRTPSLGTRLIWVHSPHPLGEDRGRRPGTG